MAGTSLNDLLYEFLKKITSMTEGATEDLALLALLSALDPTITIPADNVTVTPVGGVSATTVQDMIEELDIEKLGKTGFLSEDSGSLSISGSVLTYHDATICNKIRIGGDLYTINSTAYDLDFSPSSSGKYYVFFSKVNGLGQLFRSLQYPDSLDEILIVCSVEWDGVVLSDLQDYRANWTRPIVDVVQLEKKLNKSGDIATYLREANQQIITTAVTEIDWSLGHVCINYAGNTNLTGGFTNIPTDGTSWLTIEFRHNGDLRTLSLLASQLDPSATMPTLAGTSGGVDRLSLRPSLLNPGKFFIKLVESK